MDNTFLESPLLTVSDVTRKLAISRKTLWDLRKQGKISAVVINSKPRFTEEEIQRFISASLEPKS